MSTAAKTFSTSIEDYLEAIFFLMRDNVAARSKEIAERLQVKPASVTGMLQALRERGLVNYEPYGAVTLTEAGASVAQRVARRHEALRDFLIEVLAVDPAEAEAAACHMEHGISKQVVDRFVAFAEFVKSCPNASKRWAAELNGGAPKAGEAAKKPSLAQPHGCRAELKTREEGPAGMTLPLSALKPGERGQIDKLHGEGAVKRRIRDMGVTTGSVIEVVRVAPLGDPIDVKIKSYHLSLRKAEAADIMVRKVDA